MAKPEGGFLAGAELDANSKRETVDWEPRGPSPPVGVLSPRAGHPTHSLHGPLGTSPDASPPRRGHVSSTCLVSLQKGPESSLVANHCQCRGCRYMVGPAASVGAVTAMAAGIALVGRSEAAQVWFCWADAGGKGCMNPLAFPE